METWYNQIFTKPPYTEAGTFVYDVRDDRHIATIHTSGEATDRDVRLITAAPKMLAFIQSIAGSHNAAGREALELLAHIGESEKRT